MRQNAKIEGTPLFMCRDGSIYRSVETIIRVLVALTSGILRLARNIDDRRRAVCIRIRW
jgi:hypothetical protein